MKKLLIFIPFLILMWGCKKDNYPGGDISPYIAIFDVRQIFKGKEVTLTQDNMGGSGNLAVMVVSDHSEGNLPEGLLVVQDARRLGRLRGISIPLGEEAANYVPGDSLIINAVGKVLQRKDGILQLTGVSTKDIRKISSGNSIPINRVATSAILANPDNYESTLSVIVKGGFDPLPAPTDVLSGEKTLNDGFGNLSLYTSPSATFAQDAAPVSANFYGIVFKVSDSVPQLRLRRGSDVTRLSSVIEISPAIITGFASDVKGGDGNYEYVQLMATRDIDFAATPFAVVVTNNANASTPTGYPANGWATGGMRTYKFSLSQGTAKKGTFFYVGGAGKMINGSGSTDMSGSNWIRAFNYVNQNGDGFGTKTGGLFANSGNASGVAVFQDSLVTADSKPVDVIFVATGGSLWSGNKGYRITTNDWYDVINPITLEQQPFYRQGSNTMSMPYSTADLGYFIKLGGIYNAELGKWVQARAQNNFLMTKTTAVSEIEGDGATTLK